MFSPFIATESHIQIQLSRVAGAMDTETWLLYLGSEEHCPLVIRWPQSEAGGRRDFVSTGQN